MRNGRIRRNGLMIVGLMVAVAALLSSCSQTAKYSENVQSSALFGDLLMPGLEITEWAERPLVDQAVGVQPGAPITVQASEGALTNVRIDKVDGTPLRGTLSEDATRWTSAEPLGYGRNYTVQADAKGVGGTSTKRVSFTTRAPANLTQA